MADIERARKLLQSLAADWCVNPGCDDPYHYLTTSGRIEAAIAALDEPMQDDPGDACTCDEHPEHKHKEAAE